MTKSLYEQIGASTIEAVITEFYEQAFRDPLIGHFFFTHDRGELTRKQILFSSCLLGATHLTYTGKSLQEAHRTLPLNEVHFRRRQKLMQQVLAHTTIDQDLKDKWLEREEKLKGLIINNSDNCVS